MQEIEMTTSYKQAIEAADTLSFAEFLADYNAS